MVTRSKAREAALSWLHHLVTLCSSSELAPGAVSIGKPFSLTREADGLVNVASTSVLLPSKYAQAGFCTTHYQFGYDKRGIWNLFRLLKS